jgi:hypothetical protein
VLANLLQASTAILLMVAIQVICCLISAAQKNLRLFLVSTALFSGGSLFAVLMALSPAQLWINGLMALAVVVCVGWNSIKLVERAE